MFRPILLALALVAAPLAAPAPAAAADKPRIAAVNYPLSYFAGRLAGDAAEVEFPAPPGVDPAFWRPGIAEIGRIQSADLILLNGASFAAWTTKVSLPRARTVDTTRGLDHELIEGPEVTHSHGADGEHSHAGVSSFTWMDPGLAALQAEAVAEALKRARIGEPAEVDARLAALTEDLKALWVAARGLGELAAGRTLIATHPRYQYLARAAGLSIQSLEWEAGAAPDAAMLAELAALAAETAAPLLIWEAPPPEAAREAVRAAGLADVVFPTLAATPATGDFVSAYRAAVEELAAALKALPEG